MSNPGQGPPIDDSLVINTRLREIEREQAEERKRDAEYKQRQLKFNKLTVVFTGGLLLANIIYDGITAYLAHTALVSAEAAKNAAETASGSLRVMRSSSAQTERLIDETHALAANAGIQAKNAADEVLKLKGLVEATNRQWRTMKDQLEATERNSLPWVGLERDTLVPMNSPRIIWPKILPNPTISIELQYTIRNFGNFPAFRESSNFR